MSAASLPAPPWRQQPGFLRRLFADPAPVLDELAERLGPNFALGAGPLRMAVRDERDICALLIWEPYAIDHQAETAWFTQVHGDEIGLVGQILREFESALRAAILDWEADRALEAVAQLYLATGHIDGFVEAATALGSRSWIPIVAMAEHAIRSGDRDTAAAVFEAADQPGFHQGLLVDRRASLGLDR